MDSNVSLAPAPSTPSTSPLWIPFSERMPEPTYDSANPNKPTHGKILVTNNLSAVDGWGKKSHVWLVYSVYLHEARMSSKDGHVFAEVGEVIAFDDFAHRIRNLTHWRPAFPEEWPEFQSVEATNININTNIKQTSKPNQKAYNEAGGPVELIKSVGDIVGDLA